MPTHSSWLHDLIPMSKHCCLFYFFTYDPLNDIFFFCILSLFFEQLVITLVGSHLFSDAGVPSPCFVMCSFRVITKSPFFSLCLQIWKLMNQMSHCLAPWLFDSSLKSAGITPIVQWRDGTHCCKMRKLRRRRALTNRVMWTRLTVGWSEWCSSPSWWQ